jgi:adenylate cyclase
LKLDTAMPESRSRRLAAILVADVAGYSALMGADDVRTVRDLKRHQAIVLPMIGEFGGRVIDTAGDGILAEFGSVTNLLECAVAIQKIMAEQNAAIEPARRLQFRIGVNIGDVIYDEARIYGDGVNVAARLEGLAPPGGICISEDVYRQSRGKLELITEDIGEQKLKNIAEPVRVYRVRPEWIAAIPGTSRMPGKFSGRSLLLKIGGRLGVAAVGAQRFTFALVTVLLVLAIGAGAAYWHFRPGEQETPAHRLSMVVLPFKNLGNEPEQEYFAEAITDDLTADLSRIQDSFVISPGTAAPTRAWTRSGSAVSLACVTFSTAVCGGRSKRSALMPA